MFLAVGGGGLLLIKDSAACSLLSAEGHEGIVVVVCEGLREDNAVVIRSAGRLKTEVMVIRRLSLTTLITVMSQGLGRLHLMKGCDILSQ